MLLSHVVDWCEKRLRYHTFEDAKDILSKQRGTIKTYLPAVDKRYIKYKDESNTIFDKLAAGGYVEIIEDSERPSNNRCHKQEVLLGVRKMGKSLEESVLAENS